MSGYHIFDSSEINDTSEIRDEWKFSSPAEMPPDIFRFVNDLDVNVDIKGYGTDLRDGGTHDRLNQLNIYPNTGVMGPPLFRSANEGVGGESSSVTVASGNSESFYLARRWDATVVGIVPAAVPSSGDIKIIHME